MPAIEKIVHVSCASTFLSQTIIFNCILHYFEVEYLINPYFLILKGNRNGNQ